MGTLGQARLNILLRGKLLALLKTARGSLNGIKWDSLRFEQKKARCLALFSEIAYYKITEEEYRRPRRAKIVPCEAYQKAVLGGANRGGPTF